MTFIDILYLFLEPVPSDLISYSLYDADWVLTAFEVVQAAEDGELK